LRNEIHTHGIPESERESRNSGNPDSGLPGAGSKSSTAQKTTVLEWRNRVP
jgi:hypothetical protein